MKNKVLLSFLFLSATPPTSSTLLPVISRLVMYPNPTGIATEEATRALGS